MTVKGGSIVTIRRARGSTAMLMVAVSIAAAAQAEPFEAHVDVPSVLASSPDEDRLWLDAPSDVPVTNDTSPEFDAVEGPSGPSEAYADAGGPPACTGPECGVVSGGFGSGQPACGPCATNCEPPGLLQFFGLWHDKSKACWTLRSEALLLWRNAPPSRPIYSTIDPETQGLGPTALNANDLNSDVLAAPRISLLRTDCDGRTLEATYLYAGNFYSDRTLPYSPDGYATSPPGIYGNTWGPPDTNLDSATAKLTGQLQSLEFNTRHCIWGGVSQFLIGARWLQWNERLQMQDSFSYDAPYPVTGNDFYQTECFNNLWGGQIGLDTLLLGRVGQKRVEGLVKAGAYYNAAGQTSSYTYSTEPPFTFSASNRDTGPASAAFVGEVGMTAVIPISCNWDFRCGYFGLWLTGLAQPTQQLSHQTITQIDPPSGVLDTTGTLLVQGLSLGLEGRW